MTTGPSPTMLCTLQVVELVPKELVVGVFVQPPLPGVQGGAKLTRDIINRVWTEVNALYPYQNLQVSPPGDAAQFIGARGLEEGVTLQPPVLQVRDPISSTPDLAADQVQTILKIIARNLGSPPMFNLGIRFVYHAPLDGAGTMADGRAFVLGRVLGKQETDLDVLRRGGVIWGGVKYVINHPDASAFTLLIEPLTTDPKMLYLDLNAQFQGQVQLDLLKERVKEVVSFMSQTVRGYLESLPA
jgi:energy-converting hydrogenase Eha subunit B